MPVDGVDAAAPSDPAGLAALRHRIDEIDDRLHDLLMERADLIDGISRAKRATGLPALRPGREAQILRRLFARHQGRFPRRNLLRIWREIISGTVTMQGDFTVAVQLGENSPGFWDIARDHYGSSTPILAYRVSGEVIAAVADGRAAVGVLPLPEEGARDLWWRTFAVSDGAKPRIVARLPFAGSSNARSNGGSALVIGLMEPEPSGEDCGLLVLETNAEVSRARLNAALATAGLAVTPLVFAPGEGWDAHLVEIEGLFSIEDKRLVAALTSLGEAAPRVSLLGFYARPISAAALDGARSGS